MPFSSLYYPSRAGIGWQRVTLTHQNLFFEDLTLTQNVFFGRRGFDAHAKKICEKNLPVTLTQIFLRPIQPASTGAWWWGPQAGVKRASAFAAGGWLGTLLGSNVQIQELSSNHDHGPRLPFYSNCTTPRKALHALLSLSFLFCPFYTLSLRVDHLASDAAVDHELLARHKAGLGAVG